MPAMIQSEVKNVLSILRNKVVVFIESVKPLQFVSTTNNKQHFKRDCPATHFYQIQDSASQITLYPNQNHNPSLHISSNGSRRSRRLNRGEF